MLTSDIFLQKFINSSFFATKSVSEFISVKFIEFLSSPKIIKPSAASLELFLQLLKHLFFLNIQ